MVGGLRSCAQQLLGLFETQAVRTGFMHATNRGGTRLLKARPSFGQPSRDVQAARFFLALAQGADSTHSLCGGVGRASATVANRCLHRLAASSESFSSRRALETFGPTAQQNYCVVVRTLSLQTERRGLSVMIHPQVHLRIPCYDFYDLYPR